jgi:hypothetical protein
VIGSDRRGRTFGDAADDALMIGAGGRLSAVREAAGDGLSSRGKPHWWFLVLRLITGPGGIFDVG